MLGQKEGFPLFIFMSGNCELNQIRLIGVGDRWSVCMIFPFIRMRYDDDCKQFSSYYSMVNSAIACCLRAPVNKPIAVIMVTETRGWQALM